MGFSAHGNALRLVILTAFVPCFPLVLGIHKMPANAATDITFPMKGWRGMVDWAKNSEDKVTVSKSILSSGLTGRQHNPGTSEENVFFPSIWLVFKLPFFLWAGFAHKSLITKSIALQIRLSDMT